MGGKSGKSKIKNYPEKFSAEVSIPADIYSHFSGARVTENPKMIFGAFIELMLTKKKDEKIPINPACEVRTSILTILQLLFNQKTNYLNALKEDEDLNEASIILPLSIFSSIIPANPNIPTNAKSDSAKKKSDTRSVMSARIETGSVKSDSSKKSNKSEQKISDNIDESLSKVISPYRVTLITLLKKLLSNQTEFEGAQTSLLISPELLYNYIFSLIHALLKDVTNSTQQSTADIVSEESIRLVNDSYISSGERPTIINLYQRQLNDLSDEIPIDRKLVQLIQFYGRLFSALVAKKGFFVQFFDPSREQPQELATLGHEFAARSATLFDKLFSECLSVECNRVIKVIQDSCTLITTEADMAAYFHLLGQLVLQVVVNGQQLREFLANYVNQIVRQNVVSQMESLADDHEDTMPQITSEAKADFLECFAVLLKEFPRQALRLKGSPVAFGGIVTRKENREIYSALNTEAMRIRVAIKNNLDSQKISSIEEGTSSQENTPIKRLPPKSERSALATSMARGGLFDTLPEPQTTPTNDSSNSDIATAVPHPSMTSP